MVYFTDRLCNAPREARDASKLLADFEDALLIDFVDRLLACGASKSVSKLDHRKFQMLQFET